MMLLKRGLNNCPRQWAFLRSGHPRRRVAASTARPRHQQAGDGIWDPNTQTAAPKTIGKLLGEG